MKTLNIVSWSLRALIAVIFLQTLFYKFTGHPDSVYIFSKMGLEPYGRWGLGFAELIVAILLMMNRYLWLSILASIAIIAGAIFSHLLVIGVNIHGDHGKLFSLALIVLIASVVLLLIHRKEVLAQFKQRFIQNQV